MSRAASILALASALSLAAATPRATGAPPQTGGPAPSASQRPSSATRAGLAVDASALGDDGEGLGQRLLERAKSALLDAEVLPGRSEKDPTIMIMIERSGPQDNPIHTVSVRLLQSGAEIAGSLETSACELCTDKEIITQLEGLLVGTIAQLDDRKRSAALSTESEAATPVPERPETPEPRDSGVSKPPAQKIGPLGIGGIVTGLVGLGGLGAGIFVLTKDDKQSVDNHRATLTSYAAPGGIVLGIGTALLITGIVMVALDRGRRAPAPTTAFVPFAGRYDTGLALHHRF